MATIALKDVDKVEILTLQDNYIDLAALDGNEVVQRAMPYLLNMSGTRMVFPK
jgi:7,8-dihydropterin-6-yl-methyl-4-(beta-D-ribofuranosyl)aminobenzene 5'-phosphate synthase